MINHLIAMLLFIPSIAFAFPEAPHVSLDAPMERVLDEGFDFNGIVAMSNCSASLVHFAGQPMTSQAYVLTNGHCTGGTFGGFPKPGQVIYKKSDRRSMNVFINLNKKIRIRANQLVYGTMTDTDAAIFRINQTYDQLKAKGVNSFEMSAESPLVDDEIQIMSGYWKKGFQCSIEKIVYSLKEGNWTMFDSLRYSPEGCEVYGGTSGSPIVAKGERLVVGVNNTGNESGKKCTQNNPCEVSEEGEITVLKGRGYGQQTYWFATCLNNEFEIDLDQDGCLLAKPK